MMRRFFYLIICAGVLAASVWPGAVFAVPAPVTASIRADVRAISPGEPFKVFIDFTIDSPWHIYWKMPGEAGLPTQVNFSMPVGYKVSALEWPPHEEFLQPGNLDVVAALEVVEVHQLGPTAGPDDAKPYPIHRRLRRQRGAEASTRPQGGVSTKTGTASWLRSRSRDATSARRRAPARP